MAVNLTIPSLQQQSGFPDGVKEPMGKVLRALDKFCRDTADSISSALIISDSVRVFYPYTAAAPLVVPSDIVTLTVGSGWTAVTAPQYVMDSNGWVQTSGRVTGGTLGTVIASGLPAPAIIRVLATCANAAFGKARILTDGTCILDNGATTDVDMYFSYRSATRAPYVPSCFPFDVAWPLPYPPTVVLATCADAANQASPTNIALGAVDWVLVQRSPSQVLRVRNIPGLLQGSYSVTLVAF